jgi:hypothetical protein
MSDYPEPALREHNGIPLLGAEPPAKGERLRVLLELEFQSDPVPANRRLAQALKVLWRRFKARNLGIKDLPTAQDGGSGTRMGQGGSRTK